MCALEKSARLAAKGARRGRRRTDREAEAGWGPHRAAGSLAPLWTGSAPAVTGPIQPIQAGRGDAQPIRGRDSAGASLFASTPGASPRRRGRGPGRRTVGSTTSHPTRLGRSAGQGHRLQRDWMASEDLAVELAAVLGGRGLCVQNCDSEPAKEPLPPVRLRRNVCYVVLAVCLNEQVSVRPPALRRVPERAASPAGTEDLQAAATASLWVALSSFAKHSHLTLTSEPCAAQSCDCPTYRERNRGQEPLSQPTRPQFLEGGLSYSSSFPQNLV